MDNPLIERLSQIIPKNSLVEQLENIIGDIQLIIDEGYYMEIYWTEKGLSYVNQADILKGDVMTGRFEWIYFDIDCTYGDLLSLFLEGFVRENKLTITLIPCDDNYFISERIKAKPILVNNKNVV